MGAPRELGSIGDLGMPSWRGRDVIQNSLSRITFSLRNQLHCKKFKSWHLHLLLVRPLDKARHLPYCLLPSLEYPSFTTNTNTTSFSSSAMMKTFTSRYHSRIRINSPSSSAFRTQISQFRVLDSLLTTLLIWPMITLSLSVLASLAKFLCPNRSW